MPLFLFSERGRSRLAERFGAWNLKEKKVIWFHGASYGEISGILPLLERVRREYPTLRTLVTATSVTGLKLAENKANHVRLLPFDSAVWLAHATDGIEIKTLIITETELWPGLITYLHKKGVPVYIINGRLRDSAYPKYKLFRYFLRRIFKIPKIILTADIES